MQKYRMKNKENIHDLIQQAIQNKIFPGIEILCAKSNSILFHEAFGHLDKSEKSNKLEKNSLFDLASLTKPIATASGILCLIESGKIHLNDDVFKYIPEFKASKSDNITIRHLLTHTSGLPDWEPLYDKNFDQTKGWKKLVNIPLKRKPDTKMVYSCLGYLLLAEIIRRISDTSLNEFCKKYIFIPLNLISFCFNPKQSLPGIVPTAYCPLRKKYLRGIVHDENSYLFGGEGGNAGLFGTITDVYGFCHFLCSKKAQQNNPILSQNQLQLFFKNLNPSHLDPRSAGWDYHTGKAEYMSCSQKMPIGSVGHLGFTGTSVWFDSISELIIIILSNRVNFSREQNIPQMRAFRPAIHQALLETVF